MPDFILINSDFLRVFRNIHLFRKPGVDVMRFCQFFFLCKILRFFPTKILLTFLKNICPNLRICHPLI